jgi:hypothetical protein
MNTPPDDLVRQLARVAEPLHSCSYYAEEITRFNAAGYNGWWHAYFGYRSAPLGAASAEQVTQVFYNFAPRMVERAVPSCWEILDPRQTRALHQQLVEEALSRIFHAYDFEHDLVELTEALKSGISTLDSADKPLFAAWANEQWPNLPLMGLWHASTLLREYRFDSHNHALRSAAVSGLGCHLLMVADGRGTPEIIQKIRGWTREEWNEEAGLLFDRGWLDEDGRHTEMGRRQRKGIELETDRGCAPLGSIFDDATASKILSTLESTASFLVQTGVVPGTWPPKHLGQLDAASNGESG